MKCPKCDMPVYRDGSVTVDCPDCGWVSTIHEPDPAPVIKAAREVGRDWDMGVCNAYRFRELVDALRAYDAQRGLK